MKTLLTTLSRGITRLRLRMAAGDLAFMEARAPLGTLRTIQTRRSKNPGSRFCVRPIPLQKDSASGSRN